MPVIKVTSAYKEFKSKSETKCVMKDFHMKVQRGSIYALMGSSGCGKTTLISCLVGLSKLDKGEIHVFNQAVGKNASKIGYMPQDLALIKEFNIREMLHFYGVIYGMKKDQIFDRIWFLCKLLDLNDTEQLIANLSGGQQRRVSFAIALVHEPEILILDEPTVGVDPLLRQSIWNHLEDIAKTKNVTILLSTHYIEEAQKSTHVGLMRKGVLLVEDAPRNLIRKCGTTTLDETFLKLSEQQEKGFWSREIFTEPDMESFLVKKSSFVERVEAKALSYSTKLKALMIKNFIQLRRSPWSLILTAVMPLFLMACLFFAIGNNPKGLIVGIVNEELESFEECSNNTQEPFRQKGHSCFQDKISCRYIAEITDDVAIKKFYKTPTEAMDDAKKGKTVGFISFSKNFTKNFPFINAMEGSWDFTEGSIQIYLDHTDLQIVSFLQKNFYSNYNNFVTKIMRECGKSEKIGKIPMIFETFNGSLSDGMKLSMVPGLLIASFFAMVSYASAITLIGDRQCGIWDRTLIAGATQLQFLISQLVHGSILMLIQATAFISFAIYIGNPGKNFEQKALLVTLIILIGVAGTLFGLLISLITNSTQVATFLSLMLLYPLLSLAGIFWPLEGSPLALQYFSVLLPFTLPSKSFMSIMFHELTLADSRIYLGFFVIIIWIILLSTACTVLCFMESRRKKQ